MITTLPIVPANIKHLRLGDEILFRFFKEWQGSLIHCTIHHQTIRKLDLAPSNKAFLWTENPDYNIHEGYFIPKEKTDYPFANEMGNEIDRYQSHIYRYSQGYYAFLFARLETKDDQSGYRATREFIDLDSLVAKINAIRPQ